jgi:uncharacterized pyridoxamine 5'-phosphate oxidase family protein
MHENNDSGGQVKNRYSVNDGIFEVLYFTEATATICSFTEKPEEITL